MNDPIAKRWNGKPLPRKDVFRQPRLESMAAGLGYSFRWVRQWHDSPRSIDVMQAVRGRMVAEVDVNYRSGNPELDALARLDRTLRGTDSTAPAGIDVELI